MGDGCAECECDKLMLLYRYGLLQAGVLNRSGLHVLSWSPDLAVGRPRAASASACCLLSYAPTSHCSHRFVFSDVHHWQMLLYRVVTTLLLSSQSRTSGDGMGAPHFKGVLLNGFCTVCSQYNPLDVLTVKVRKTFDMISLLSSC